MAYTKTTWAAGDTVTSTKLNKIEQGIYDASNSGGVFYINGTLDDSYHAVQSISNVTGQQILDAVNAGKIVAIKGSGNDYISVLYFFGYEIEDNNHYFYFSNTNDRATIYAASLSANLSVVATNAI